MIELHLQKKIHTVDGEQMLDVAFQIKQGCLVALYGESGVGKTTLLRMLAGLTRPDGGYIRVDGNTWFDSATNRHLSPQKREIGLVFQHYALFPHMTVRQNLEYALDYPKDQSWIEELLSLSQLTKLADRRPGMLSGGQQQRAALIRALARKPRVLLLDEPLSSLDLLTRRRLRQEIRRMHAHFHMTTLLVSHDAEEVASMADEVIVLEKGKISLQGNPASVFNKLNIPLSAALENPQLLWVQGTVQAIVSDKEEWLIEVKIGESTQHMRVAKQMVENRVWQIGDLVEVPLSLATQAASLIRKA